MACFKCQGWTIKDPTRIDNIRPTRQTIARNLPACADRPEPVGVSNRVSRVKYLPLGCGPRNHDRTHRCCVDAKNLGRSARRHGFEGALQIGVSRGDGKRLANIACAEKVLSGICSGDCRSVSAPLVGQRAKAIRIGE